MQLSDVVTTSHTVAATSSRTAKVEALAACLRRAAQDGPDVVEVVTAHLSGVLPQRRIGVSWRGLQGLPDPAGTTSLTVEDVDAAATAIAAIGGSGSGAARSAAVRELFGRATADEQAWLRGLITGETRQGAGDGVMLQAIAKAAAVPDAAVRRAVMLAGFAGPVARATLDVETLVLDGEVIALGEGGRPQPFQVTGARTASSADVDRLRAEVPLTPDIFDLLHLAGTD